jgi:hypothetical protein
VSRRKDARDWWRGLRAATARHVQRGGQTIHRVAERSYARAKLSGAKMAAHIISIQRAAKLPDRAIERTVRSAVSRPATRDSDLAWRSGYLRAAQARIPALAPPQPAPAAPAPPRPAWPSSPNRTDPDKEAAG